MREEIVQRSRTQRRIPGYIADHSGLKLEIGPSRRPAGGISQQWKAICEMRPGDVLWVPHGDLYCVQEGIGQHSCAISKMVWRANRQFMDQVFRARHALDGDVRVACHHLDSRRAGFSATWPGRRTRLPPVESGGGKEPQAASSTVVPCSRGSSTLL